jgi:RNA polymerase sigma-70 factor (ECF subfamily)
MMSESDWPGFLARLRQNDGTAWQTLWKEYGERLMRLIEGRLSATLRRRVGAEDVLASVFRTFWRRLSTNEYQFEEGRDLWSLLSTIALNKARTQARYHRRDKRDVRREETDDPADPNRADRIGQVPAPESLPDAVEVAEQFDQLCELLSDEELQIVALRLQGETQAEIGKQVNRSERWVREVLKKVERRLRPELWEG